VVRVKRLSRKEKFVKVSRRGKSDENVRGCPSDALNEEDMFIGDVLRKFFKKMESEERVGVVDTSDNLLPESLAGERKNVFTVDSFERFKKRVFGKSSRADHLVDLVSSLAALKFAARPKRVGVLAGSIVGSESRTIEYRNFPAVDFFGPERQDYVNMSLEFRRRSRDGVFGDSHEKIVRSSDNRDVRVCSASSIKNSRKSDEIQVRMVKRRFSEKSRVKIERARSIGIVELFHVSSPGEISLVASNKIRNELLVGEVDGITVNNTHEAVDSRVKRVTGRVLRKSIFFILSESARSGSTDAIRDSDDGRVGFNFKFEIDAAVESFRTDERLDVRTFNVRSEKNESRSGKDFALVNHVSHVSSERKEITKTNDFKKRRVRS